MYDAVPSGVGSMCCIRIERTSGGFEVSATDPKIAEENAKPNSKWRDSCRKYPFKTVAEVTAFIGKIAATALPLEDSPPDPFAKAFEAATKSET